MFSVVNIAGPYGDRLVQQFKDDAVLNFLQFSMFSLYVAHSSHLLMIRLPSCLQNLINPLRPALNNPSTHAYIIVKSWDAVFSLAREESGFGLAFLELD